MFKKEDENKPDAVELDPLARQHLAAAPKDRYGAFHAATVSRTRLTYGGLGVKAAEFAAGMIEFLRYVYPVDQHIKDEAVFYRFYQQDSQFIEKYLSMPEDDRATLAQRVIEAMVSEMYPNGSEENRATLVSSYIHLFNQSFDEMTR